MIHKLASCVLRPLETCDAQYLYEYKNDPEISALLGGFHTGLSRTDVDEWIEFHRTCKDEVVWAITDPSNGNCWGHVGLYKIDNRIGSAEFAIMVGAKQQWGRGIGRAVTSFVVEWGFCELNLRRICLSVLATNERAIKLYRSIGFFDEGRLSGAQFKGGRYIDVVIMAKIKGDKKLEHS